MPGMNKQGSCVCFISVLRGKGPSLLLSAMSPPHDEGCDQEMLDELVGYVDREHEVRDLFCAERRRPESGLENGNECLEGRVGKGENEKCIVRSAHLSGCGNVGVTGG